MIKNDLLSNLSRVFKIKYLKIEYLVCKLECK